MALPGKWTPKKPRTIRFRPLVCCPVSQRRGLLQHLSPPHPHPLAHPPTHPPPSHPPSQRGYKVRALSRSADKVRQQFGDAPGLTATIADLRDPASLPAALEGVDAVVCCTGTTAFPSKR